jgi:ABC-2 type transport system permease protein
MKYALLIALREFGENAKTKGFWIGLLVFPVLIGLSIGVSALLAGSTSTRHFIVVDQSGELADAVDRAVERARQGSVLGAVTEYARANARATDQQRPSLSAIPADGGPPGDRSLEIDRFVAAGGAAAFLERIGPSLRDDAPEFTAPRAEFVRIDPPDDVDTRANLDDIARALRPYLTGDRLLRVGGQDVRPFAALLIGPRALDAVARPGDSPAAAESRSSSPVQYWSSNLTDNDLPRLVGTALNDEIRRREYVELGISPDIVQRVDQTGLRMSSYDPSKQEGQETVSVADRIVQNAPVGFVYLLWLSIFVIMQMLLNNTIEEKSNRIVEVLLSSVTPGELMMGKLIGIAGIGVAMIGTWLAAAFVGLRLYRGAGAEVIGQALEAVSGSGLVATFVFYFVFGYLLYAGIFLSIGSLCRSLKDAQNLQGPLMIIMMVPLLTMVFINQDPHGALATVMTWIPIYTPFVMMNRAAADPPLFDLIGTTLLMIATTIVVLWLSGRIFRIGILRVGQRARLRDLVQWVRGTPD